MIRTVSAHYNTSHSKYYTRTSPDESFVKRLKEADTSAWRACRFLVYRWAKYWCHSTADADDITQQILLRVLLKLQTFRSKSRFTSWLYRLAFRAMVDEKRRFARQAWAGQLLDNDSTPTVQSFVHLTELKDLVTKALRRLTASQRQVLTKFYIDGFSAKEIAAAHNIPLTTVGSRLAAGKRNLRKEFVRLGVNRES